MKVQQITFQEAKPWFLNKHYAKRVPSVSFAYGLFYEGELRGVVSYGSPASPSLVKGVCGEEHSKKVIELNRLVIDEGMPKNSASFLIANSIKLLPKPKIIVSYADTQMEHVGKVYQATNFLYTGASKPRTDIDTGEKHSRHYEGITDYSKRKFRSSKHRYIYFHGCHQKEKRALKYSILPYPKGISKRYTIPLVSKQLAIL